MSFNDLGLEPELLRAVADKGYTTPTPIQKQAIPAVLSGRDVLARVLAGARISLAVGFGATAAALLLGTIVGTASGFAGRGVDGVLTKAIEVVTAFPEFLLALVVIAIIGPGPVGVAVAIRTGCTPSARAASTAPPRRATRVLARETRA